jgi:N-acetyl-1-D-myo-inositol-2-amino-2-deoxy-alpha-D-glucopyranoside deacetylase
MQRLLLVHAHPDDETIDNGATIARYVASGAQVTLVTCTLGEEGDILVPELVHLGSAHEDRLAERREVELKGAMSALGLSDHRLLGGAGRHRDSGMMDSASNTRPGCFWRADVHEAARHLVEIIREVRPQVMVTYNPDGGYGHPDHIQAHRVAMRAAELAGDDGYSSSGHAPHAVSKIYWNCFPRMAARAGIEALRAHGSTPFELPASEDEINAVDDSFATCAIDGSGYVGLKTEAMRAHATQLGVSGGFFALSNGIGRLIAGIEYYRLASSRVNVDGTFREDDLFAGI